MMLSGFILFFYDLSYFIFTYHLASFVKFRIKPLNFYICDLYSTATSGVVQADEFKVAQSVAVYSVCLKCICVFLCEAMFTRSVAASQPLLLSNLHKTPGEAEVSTPLCLLLCTI